MSKKKNDVVHRTDRLPDFVEALIERSLSATLRAELEAYPLTLHEAAGHGDEAAELLRPAAASIVRSVRELLSPHVERWDQEAGGPPPRPAWIEEAARKTATVTDAQIVEAASDLFAGRQRSRAATDHDVSEAAGRLFSGGPRADNVSDTDVAQAAERLIR